MKIGSGTNRFGLDRFSGVYLWLFFVLVFGIWIPNEFLTSATLHSVASGQAVAGMLAIAVLIPLACGNFDLSVGANANLIGIFAGILQTEDHVPMGVAVVVSILAGTLIGLTNGLVIVKLKVSSFITTLGMGSILAAIQTIITGGQEPNPVTSSSWNNLTQLSVGGFQIVVVYLIVLGLLAWWLLDHTPIGRYLYAIGGNREAARLSGVRVDRWSWISMGISGGIAGLAGVMFTSLVGPSLTFGSSLLLPAFAAAFLGATQLQPGRFNVWGTLIAIYVLATGVEGLQLVSGQEWLSDMFNGVALIIAVALAVNQRHSLITARKGRRAAVPHTGASGGEGELLARAGASATAEADTSAEGSGAQLPG